MYVIKGASPLRCDPKRAPHVAASLAEAGGELRETELAD
jgi:hypothetical protein